MYPWVQFALVALGIAGAAGTWLRAIIALREHRAATRERAYLRLVKR